MANFSADLKKYRLLPGEILQYSTIFVEKENLIGDTKNMAGTPP